MKTSNSSSDKSVRRESMISSSFGIRPATMRMYSTGFSMRAIFRASTPCCSKSSASAVRKACDKRFLAPLARPPVLGRPFSNNVIRSPNYLALIFIPAVTFRYWQGWAYVAVFIICSGAYTVYLAKHDPVLLKRRTEAGIYYEREFTQKAVIALLFAAFVVLIVLPPLDVRFRWSLMPW